MSTKTVFKQSVGTSAGSLVRALSDQTICWIHPRLVPVSYRGFLLDSGTLDDGIPKLFFERLLEKDVVAWVSFCWHLRSARMRAAVHEPDRKALESFSPIKLVEA